MIPDPTEARFDLSGDTLMVSGDLGPHEEKAFVDALRGLVETEAESLVLDLSGVRYLGSSYVRHVAKMLMEAKKEGKAVTVRAHQRVVRILEMGGLDKLGAIENLGGEKAGEA